MDVRPGTKINAVSGNNYRVVGVARGGMGGVYFAEGPGYGSEVDTVAIKVPLGLSATARDLFRREGLIWLHLGDVVDSFLVPLYRVEEFAGMPGLVMPFYPEGNLRQAMASSLTLLHKYRVVTQIMIGLKQLSLAGVVHRDLKPENVLVAADRVCLTDYGISSATHADNRSVRHAGTLPYMSPEQLAGDICDGMEDIWALGVMAFELFVGHRPFVGSDAQEIGRQIAHGIQPWHMEVLAQSVPDRVCSVLATMLASKRTERITSITEVAAAWDGAVRIMDPDLTEHLTNVPAAHVLHPVTYTYWTGLFFPDRAAQHGLEHVSVKYTAAVCLRTAENAYRLGEYRAALEHLVAGFGQPLSVNTTWERWRSRALPAGDCYLPRGPYRYELQPGAETTESAIRCWLRTCVALLEDEPSAPERDEANNIAKMIGSVEHAKPLTRELAAQVFTYARSHEDARRVLLPLLDEDPHNPRVWHVLGLNEALAGSSREALRELAAAAVEARLSGPRSDYVHAYLWAVAGDFAAALPHSKKAVYDPELGYSLQADVAAFLWNGGAREEALELLDRLEEEASTIPRVGVLLRQLGARLTEWRDRNKH